MVKKKKEKLKLKSWKQLLPSRNWWHLSGQWTSGEPNLRYLYSVIFAILSVLGYYQNIDNKDGIVTLVFYTAFFAILSALNAFLKSNYIIIVSNIVLGSLTIWDASFANLTALLFILPIAYVVSFMIKNNKLYYPLMGWLFLIVIINEKVDGRGVLETGIVLCGYIFFIYIYYSIVHRSTSVLIAENLLLKNRISIIGDAKHMTNDQIIQKYPYMEYAGKKGIINPYLKIELLRMLSDGSSRKEIAYKTTLSERQVDRIFDDIKHEFGVTLELCVQNNTHLIKCGGILDVIQITTGQKEF